MWLGLALTAGVAADVAKPAAGAEAKPDAAQPKSEAQLCYEQIVGDYMHSKWVSLEEARKGWLKHRSNMTAEQRADVAYVLKAYGEHRPAWWKHTHASRNTTFTVTIWGKSFKANYVPSEILGVHVPVMVEEDRLAFIVSWQPHLIDSPKPISGGPPKDHGMTEGDFGEAIVWHELGHNYISQGLTPRQLFALYEKRTMMFTNLQEFYADMTAMYHSSPSARKATMMMRMPGLRYNDESEPHTRGGHGVGALVLSYVLTEPRKWPSFRLPGRVPENQVEQRTIVYMYSHLDPNYTLTEDRALRETLGRFMRANGGTILRSYGVIPLPSKLEFKIMPAEDRTCQAQRDLWVKKQLAQAIQDGLTDKPEVYDKEKEREDQGIRLFDYLLGIRVWSSPLGERETKPTTRPKAKPEPAPKPKPEPAPKPKPQVEPVAKPEPQPKPSLKPAPAEESPEDKADKLLQRAENYLHNRMTSLAAKTLREILQKYPKTAAAKRAKKLMEDNAIED
jgi:hypothetical protein